MNILIDLVILSVLFFIQASFVLYVAGPLILLKPTRRTEEWYKQRQQVVHPSELQLPWQDVSFETFDGFILRGWFIVRSDARATLVYLHGVGDCMIAGLPFAKYFFEK